MKANLELRSTEGPRAMGHRPEAGGSLSRKEGFGRAVGTGVGHGNSVCSTPPKGKRKESLWLS
jgi:hypothetical protein